MEGILIVRQSFNDSKITKIPITDCICKTKLHNHDLIRDNLLDVINNSECGSLCNTVSNISKLDWETGEDFSREWVKILFPNYDLSIINMIKDLGYAKHDTFRLWFQQYLEGGTHPWHIHSNHFTGVYYLEYPEGCGKTRVSSPYNLEGHDVDAVEGDIIIFPAHWVHRGSANNKDRKTIISFNFDIIGMSGMWYNSEDVILK
tara:strand:- start:41 stop:649 length:609 start_codon:yes stop_codon:yes gene_type:complete